MSTASVAAGTPPVRPDHDISVLMWAAAVICLMWYVLIIVICTTGVTQIWRYFSSPEAPAEWDGATAPHVTIIRPVKGLEPRLYDCLASTFRQDYPKEKLHLRLCISDRNDISRPIIERLLENFPDHDAQLLVEDEDDLLQSGRLKLGPNPKIRNMTRAYREAPGDHVWVIDCNIWVAKGVCGRMIAKMEGHGTGQKYKFVHHLPITVDIADAAASDESQSLMDGDFDSNTQIRTTSSASHATLAGPSERTLYSIGGGRMDEEFMASMHGKFYVAINTVAVAPCIMGKSTMFRRSHLNSLTDDQGINFFSEYICEDHLIGDILWKQQVPEERQGKKLGNHAMCFGDIAVQPIANMSLGEYWTRRIRWLRVRKFTVTLATFVEPGTESFVCSFYGAFAVSTLPFFHNTFGMPQTWTALGLFWLLSVSIWCFMDRMQYLKLHSGATIEKDENTPSFARGGNFRPFGEWFLAWLGRESLALPIWLLAFWGGATVEWRGRKFWVGMDMKVHEIAADQTSQADGVSQEIGKARNE